MIQSFASGTTFPTIKGNEIHIEKTLAEYGEKSVYKVSLNGQEKVFCWHKFGSNSNELLSFWKKTQHFIQHGSPCDSILWPEDVTALANDGFGYILPVIPDGYHGFEDFLSLKTSFPSYRVLIDAAINLVATFYKIHMQGYCFYSLLADFLINPANGKVLFTDTEYLDIEGTQYRVLNKPRYMAPEVVLGNDSYGVTNDRFVLGIYLFMLLCKAHPLEGKRYLVPGWTAGHEKRLYGSEPLFMMDPDDNSNAPHPIIHRDAIALWNQLPGYIRHLFIRTFGQSGLRNPSMRPLEKDWLNALMRYRGEIFQCTCGNEIHVEAGKTCQCDSCNKDICPAYSLEFDEYSIPAIKGYTIYRSQLGICAPSDILQPIGRLVEKKGIPGVLGIRNLSDVKWKAIISDGKIGVVLPNQVVQLEMDMKLEFHGSRLAIKEHKSPHTIG